jgi:uncharacterized membrane protein (UPF0182 family)
VVLIALILALTGFITNYLWFKDIGQTPVFWTKLLTQIKIGVPIFIVLSGLAFFYLNAIKRGYQKRITLEKETVGKKVQTGVKWLFSLASGGIMTYLACTRLWYEFLQFTHSSSFGIDDPIFSNDVSFYVFKLQFVKDLNTIVITGVVVFAALTFLYYWFLLSALKPQTIDGEPAEERDDDDEAQPAKPGMFANFMKSMGISGQPSNSPFSSTAGLKTGSSLSGGSFKELLHIASKQIIAIGIIFFLMVGVNFFLKQFELLYQGNGTVYGAGWTQINITLWVYRIVIVLSVVAAIFFAMGVKKKKVRTMLTVPVIMIVISLIGTGVGFLFQNFVVSPDELNKEKPYLENNIKFTRAAYDLTDVTVTPFEGNNNLTSEDVQANMDTIKNIRINDYDPTKTFYNSTQTIRQYYTFNSVNVDRYMVNGEYTQTFISAREIDQTKTPQQWMNIHLKYTHGYGVTMSRVDKITASGQPDTLIKNVPPQSDVEEIQITRPEIYFGEISNDYIVTNTDEQEFDYSTGSDTIYSTFEGDTGIEMNAFNRLMFSIKEKSLKLLVSSNIDSKSKIVINRNITNRVTQIMPYLQYSDPYMVTNEGQLYWIIDAYTTSSSYPYSEPYSGNATNPTNYIRNSVKVVVNAYSGETNYYLVDTSDPVALTMSKIYPSLFKNFDKLDAGLQSHIRYPNTMLNIQANIYKKYHVTDYKVFYQGEDRWDIATEKLGASEKEVTMTPNYYIMKLPGEKDVEFVNSIPYTPATKPNMTGLLVARNDGEHYGEMMLYQLPKGRIIMGPSQIDAQISQNPVISQDFSLWANTDSTYSRGNMFVFPIKDSLLYVEPIYLRAADNSLPEVNRIIIYYGDRTAYSSTLAGALDEMFGDGTGDQIQTSDPVGDDGDADQEPGDVDPNIGKDGDGQQQSVDSLINQAIDSYAKATAAQKAGDWATYGTEIAKVETYLKALQALSSGEKAAA